MEAPKIPPRIEEIKINADLADSAPDSTSDNRPRPHGWKPPLVDPDNQPLVEPTDEKNERPYNH